MDFLLDILKFLCETCKRVIDVSVRLHKLLEVFYRQILSIRSIIVFILDELKLGFECSICFTILSVLFVFENIHFSCFLNKLELSIDFSLFLSDLVIQIFDLGILNFNVFSSNFKFLLCQFEIFLQLHEFIKKAIMLFSLLSEFIAEVFVYLLLLLFLGNEIFDFWVLISLKFGQESFQISFFFSFKLLLKIFISLVSFFFCVIKFFLLLLKVLSSINHLFYLYVEVLMLGVHVFDLVFVLVGLSDEILQFTHTHVLLLGLFSVINELLFLILLLLPQICDQLGVSIMSVKIKSSERCTLVKLHFESVVFFHLLLILVFKVSAFSFKIGFKLASIFAFLFSIVERLLDFGIVLVFFIH